MIPKGLKADGARVKNDNDSMLPLYEHYKVERIDDKANKHKSCDYFVIDWNHDKFAIPAMEAYANACEEEYPLLASNLRERIEGVYQGDNPGTFFSTKA